jgi:hypothetical protein
MRQQARITPPLQRSTREHIMRASVASSIISRLAAAVTALWLCGTGAAWAGSGGGADLASLNTALSDLCTILKVTYGVPLPSCPQVPTVAQGVLQLAAWNLVPTEMIRATNSIPLKGAVNAGNPSIPPVGPVPPPITAFPVGGGVLSNLLPNLTPLAFKGPDAIGKTVTVTLSTNGATPVASKILNFASTTGLIAGQNYSIVDTTTPTAISTGTTLISFTGTAVTMSANAAGPGVGSGDKIALTPIATATQLDDPDAGAFLYAVGSLSASSTQTTQPDSFYILYEDLSRSNQTFNKNQIVAYFSLPLTVLSGGSESLVMTNLQVVAVCDGGPACLQAQAIGGMGTPQKPIPTTQLGIKFGLVFAPSPISTNSHAFFELQVPLVITGVCSLNSTPCSPDTDPLYFFNPISNVAFAFTADETGFPQANGTSIGIGPAAVPLCSGTGPCPPPTPPHFFALCAKLPGGNSNGNGQAPVPAVAAYYAISTAGETLLTAPLNGFSGSVCPF